MVTVDVAVVLVVVVLVVAVLVAVVGAVPDDVLVVGGGSDGPLGPVPPGPTMAPALSARGSKVAANRRRTAAHPRWPRTSGAQGRARFGRRNCEMELLRNAEPGRATMHRRARLRRGRGSRRERGAVAVEFALIVPLFLTLVVGIIEFGMLFWNLSSIQTAVSAATRTASTQSRVVGYELAVRDIAQLDVRGRSTTPVALVVYRADPNTGRPTDIAASTKDYMQCTANCWKFAWNATAKTFDLQGTTSWPADAQRACGPTASTDFLGVWLEVTNNGMVSGRRKLHASGITRLEPVPLANGQRCQP